MLAIETVIGSLCDGGTVLMVFLVMAIILGCALRNAAKAFGAAPPEFQDAVKKNGKSLLAQFIKNLLK